MSKQKITYQYQDEKPAVYIAAGLRDAVLYNELGSAPPKGENEVSTNDNLITASQRGDIAEVSRLITKGVDINARDNFGWTALMQAANNGHAKTVTILIAKGADVNARDNTGWTALMVAASYNDVEIITALIAAGATNQEE